MRRLKLAPKAEGDLENITNPGLKNQVKKALGLLQTNLRHPSCNDHRHKG